MKEKVLTRQFIWGNLIVFSTYLIVNLFLAPLPVYIKLLTESDTYAGLMTTVFTIGCLATRFIAGTLLDQFGNKKIILFGSLLMAISTASFLLIEALPLILLFRTLQGAGFSIASMGLASYITKVLHPEKLVLGIGYMNTVVMLTSATGPFIAFAVIGENYQHFYNLFIIAAVIAAISTLFTLRIQEVPLHREKHTDRPASAAVHNRLIILLPFLIVFLNSLTQCGIVAFISLHMIDLDLAGAGTFLSMNAVGSILATLSISYIAERFGNLKTAALFSLLFCFSAGRIAVADSSVELLILAVIAGYSMASLTPIFNVYILSLLPQTRIGLANAIFYSAKDLGFCIGGIFWGMIATVFSYPAIFYSGALLQAVAAVFCLMQLLLFRRKEEPEFK